MVIRDLLDISEFQRAEQLQYQVWGADDSADPFDLMMAIQHEGGLVAGAFRGADLLGYVFGFPTRDPKVQHSHRLAVLPEARGLGLGLALKRYQRNWCLERGMELIRWTFDPLRRTNANLNINRLGAEARTYLSDYYGTMKGINAGTPSDRLLAEWNIASPRAARLAEGRHADPASPAAQRVNLPADFAALLRDHPEEAMAERLRIRAAITTLFENGYALVGFEPASGDYVLEPAGDGR